MPKAPGQTDMRSDRDDALHSISDTVDNIADDVVGFRPARSILRVFKTLSPANVVHQLTGLPKPSKVVDQVQSQIEGSAKSVSRGRGSLPSPKKLLPKFR